ncbi:MAG: hypothetical protein V9E82_03795 [Candidatus Nanopelagicales bacterium]
MRAKSGSVPAAASASNSLKGTKWVANLSRSRGQWITPVSGIWPSSTYTFQVLPCASSRSNNVSAVLSLIQWVTGVLAVPPVGSGVHVPAVQNERFMNVWDGTSQNQWSKTPNSRAKPLRTGTCSGV